MGGSTAGTEQPVDPGLAEDHALEYSTQGGWEGLGIWVITTSENISCVKICLFLVI